MAITCMDFLIVEDNREEAEAIKDGLCEMFAGIPAFIENDLMITPVRQQGETFLFNVIMFKGALEDEKFVGMMQAWQKISNLNMA